MDLIYNNNVYKSFTKVVHKITTQVSTSLNDYFLNSIQNSMNLQIIISTERKLRASKVKYKLSNRDHLRKLKSRE
jgi:hypothetical protein